MISMKQQLDKAMSNYNKNNFTMSVAVPKKTDGFTFAMVQPGRRYASGELRFAIMPVKRDGTRRVAITIMKSMMVSQGWKVGDRIDVGFDVKNGAGLIRRSPDGALRLSGGSKNVGKASSSVAQMLWREGMPDITGSWGVDVLERRPDEIIFLLPKPISF
jgi:hypothetical protein